MAYSGSWGSADRMRFEGLLVPATFLARPNRFLGVVRVGSREALCFIPNPGRMGELLHPDAEVYLIERGSKARRTRYDLIVVDLEGMLVSVDSRVPNVVVSEAIEAGGIPEFSGLSIERKELPFGDSRLDFQLMGDSGQLLLEVKSCTLVRNGTAIFPDAPTARGTRHLRSLVDGLSMGRSAVFFLIQRPDAVSLRPNDLTDPVFGLNLREAFKKGVEVHAYNSEVTLEGVSIKQRVPVLLDP
ncbi:MAG: DNA/RNA nuclease SfsA [Candidatus Bathyarchaeota archaeon]|nr:DNA/RNA nuclease SfsA [Candidatus Bathyarchaeota archaeon]